MSKLPTQLKWSVFVAALNELGYKSLRSRGGSARHFQKGNENPVTFHEPHGNDTIRQGTLGSYLRALRVDVDAFMSALDRPKEKPETLEERYVRRQLSDGVTVSHCSECCNIVAKASMLEEILAAEALHVCPAA